MTKNGRLKHDIACVKIASCWVKLLAWNMKLGSHNVHAGDPAPEIHVRSENNRTFLGRSRAMTRGIVVQNVSFLFNVCGQGFNGLNCPKTTTATHPTTQRIKNLCQQLRYGAPLLRQPVFARHSMISEWCHFQNDVIPSADDKFSAGAFTVLLSRAISWLMFVCSAVLHGNFQTSHHGVMTTRKTVVATTTLSAALQKKETIQRQKDWPFWANPSRRAELTSIDSQIQSDRYHCSFCSCLVSIKTGKSRTRLVNRYC